LASVAVAAPDGRKEMTGETIVFSLSLFFIYGSTSVADCFAAATISIPPALYNAIADEPADDAYQPA
jgi:hypothetical protein